MEAREVEPAVMAGLRWLLSGLGLDCCRALRGGGRGHDLKPQPNQPYEMHRIRTVADPQRVPRPASLRGVVVD